MSLGANTITISVNAVNKVLKRINQDGFATMYYLHEDLEEWTINVRHTVEAPQKDGTQFDRHNVELVHTVFATATLPAKTRITYVVIRNLRSDSFAEIGYDVIGVADLLKVAGNVPDLLARVG